MAQNAVFAPALLVALLIGVLLTLTCEPRACSTTLALVVQTLYSRQLCFRGE